MLCENCGKNPAQTYIRNANGKQIEVHLCSACYRALYPEKENDFFTSFVDGGAGGRSCPACGTTFDEFRRTGLLGCAQCYSAFREELTNTVRGIQGKVRHVGKRPSVGAEEKYDMMRAYVTQRETLKEGLEKAMRERDYETARRLQRELRLLNGKIPRGEAT